MRHENSHLLLLHVLEPPAVFEPDQSLWKREEQAKIFLKNASAQLQSADFEDIEIRVADGEASSKIVEIAQPDISSRDAQELYRTSWNTDLDQRAVELLEEGAPERMRFAAPRP